MSNCGTVGSVIAFSDGIAEPESRFRPGAVSWAGSPPLVTLLAAQ